MSHAQLSHAQLSHGEPRTVTPAASQIKLVLSLFPGADLLGRGFELAGYCVVRGPDTLLGQDICAFHPVIYAFEGIIGGPPFQDFRRCPPRSPSWHGRKILIVVASSVTQG